MKKFVFASDLHGDMQDAGAVETLLAFVKKFKPDVRVFGGDLFDFRNIRRGAGARDLAGSMEADAYAGIEFLGKFKPNVFLLGNHDKRLWDTAAFSPHGMVSDLAQKMVKDIKSRCRKLKCQLIEYKVPVDGSKEGYYDLGNVRFCHGYASGVYATKKHAEAYAPKGGVILHGHTHTISYHSVARVGGGSGMGVGCLARLDMSYNRHMLGRLIHSHGFAYGWVDGSDWQVFQAKKGRSGKWLMATKIETF